MFLCMEEASSLTEIFEMVENYEKHIKRWKDDIEIEKLKVDFKSQEMDSEKFT